MIKGMTGFGSAQFVDGQFKVMIEIKSLNHRYFDINYYFPAGFSFVEQKVRQILQKHIERGRITISVKVAQKTAHDISLNKKVIKRYFQFAKNLTKEFGLKNDLTMAGLIPLPGVLEMKETSLDPEIVWPRMEKGFLMALNGLMSMRKREGLSITKDLSDKLKRMVLQSDKIQKRYKMILGEKQKQLTSEEFQSFQKGTDINEEISRLKHYIDEMRGLLKNSDSVGKRIDFIAQEMQRETNTIGSKLQDSVASNAVIALKSKIEKIREQAQNVE